MAAIPSAGAVCIFLTDESCSRDRRKTGAQLSRLPMTKRSFRSALAFLAFAVSGTAQSAEFKPSRLPDGHPDIGPLVQVRRRRIRSALRRTPERSAGRGWREARWWRPGTGSGREWVPAARSAHPPLFAGGSRAEEREGGTSYVRRSRSALPHSGCASRDRTAPLSVPDYSG